MKQQLTWSFRDRISTHFERSHCKAARKSEKQKKLHLEANGQIKNPERRSRERYTHGKKHESHSYHQLCGSWGYIYNKQHQHRRARMNRIKQNGINLNRAEAKQTIFAIAVQTQSREATLSACSYTNIWMWCALLGVCVRWYVNATGWLRFYLARRFGFFGS